MVNSFKLLKLSKQTVKLTLTFKSLNYLKSNNNYYYVRIMEILNEEKLCVANVVETLYVAYLCYDYEDEKMTIYEFVDQIDETYNLGDYMLLVQLYFELINIKRNKEFRTPFEIRTIKKRGMSIPRFKLEDIEDYYTYFVMILNVSDYMFWNADYSFLHSIVKNKQAYDGYVNSEKEKEMKKLQG